MASTDDLREAASRALATAFDGVLRLEADEAAPFWIDGRRAPPAILDAPPADLGEGGVGLCFWRAPGDILMRIFSEERFLGNSYLSGRLSIGGDLSVMARLELLSPGTRSSLG